MIKKFLSLFNNNNSRTHTINKNILQSFALKLISIALSLLIVPLTINYITPEEYGIWLTLSSIVHWISYFDLGLGHGLRNRFAESKVLGNVVVKKYVSTSYAVIALILSVIFLIFVFINQHINWNSVLNIDSLENQEFQRIMYILVGFFCLTMILKVTNSILLGDQRTSAVSLITVLEQFVILVLIFLLTKFARSSLINLAFINSVVPCIVLLLVFYYVYRKKGIFHYCKPSLKHIDFSLSPQILNLGVKFFIIQVSLLLIFQVVNIILLRNCGPDVVTQYQLSYKYYSILYMITTIILTPYWSAYTDAYTIKDYNWMKREHSKIRSISILTIPVLILMILLSPIFFKIWINDSVEIPITLHICMALYIYSMIYASIFMYILNGLGKVSLQLIIYVSFAILSIPLMNLLSIKVGVYGILLFLTAVYLCQGFFGSIQVNRILSQRATGIWAR